MLFQETVLLLYESSFFREKRQIQCSPLAMVMMEIVIGENLFEHK